MPAAGLAGAAAGVCGSRRAAGTLRPREGIALLEGRILAVLWALPQGGFAGVSGALQQAGSLPFPSQNGFFRA